MDVFQQLIHIAGRRHSHGLSPPDDPGTGRLMTDFIERLDGRRDAQRADADAFRRSRR